MERVSLIDGHIDGADTCVVCGKDIPEGSQHCVICGMGKPKKERQIDRIKAMSVEELADFMYSANDEICFANCTRDIGNKFSCKFGDELNPENCKRCMMEYLESEATSNG